MNGLKRMIATALLAGATLTGAAKAQDTSITVEATTPAKDAAADALFTSDFRTVVSNDRWTLALEDNREDGPFKGGHDFASLGYKTKAGAWDLSPALRVDVSPDGEDVFDLSLYAGRQTANGRVNFVLDAATDGFRMIRGWYAGKHLDIGAGIKAFDADADTGKLDVVAGIHSASGDAGVWASRSIDEKYGASFTMDKPYLGVVGIGQYDHGNGLGIVQASAKSGGEAMGGMFRAGLLGARVVGGQTIHPFMGPFPSYLGNGGTVNSEVVYSKSDDASFLQAQGGGKIGQIGQVGLYAGAGLREHSIEGTDAVFEGLARIPLKGGNLDLEARAAPDTTISLRWSGRF